MSNSSEHRLASDMEMFSAAFQTLNITTLIIYVVLNTVFAGGCSPQSGYHLYLWLGPSQVFAGTCPVRRAVILWAMSIWAS